MDDSALRLNLSDSRAKSLLDELDARYFHFVDGLSKPLKQIGLAETTFVGESGEDQFQGVNSLNPLITCTPWLFWETFNSLDNKSFLDIAEAGLYTALASVVLDHLVDAQVDDVGMMLLFLQALKEKGISTYQETFASHSPFWEQFERLSIEYRYSLALEIEAQSSPTGFEFEAFSRSASGKVSPMVITIAALIQSVNVGHERLISIEKSMRHAYLAGQIHDDILDWRSDLKEGHLTYFLSSMVAVDVFRKKGWPKLEELERVNNQEWKDVHSFNLVLEWFDQALDEVKELDCPGWVNYLRAYRGIAEDHQRVALAKHLVNKIGVSND